MSSKATKSKLKIHRAWSTDPDLLDTVRTMVTYPDSEPDRANGYLLDSGRDWTPGFAEVGTQLLADLQGLLGVRFGIVIYQAYRDGSGVPWHADLGYDVQAILSLGVTRTFGVRRQQGKPILHQLAHGDLIVMPSGFQDEWEHSVPVEDVPGERISLVFRSIASQ